MLGFSNPRNVAEESDALKHLILTSVSLLGRSFEGFLEEQRSFKDFIKSSMESLPTRLSAESAVTPFVCLRVTFRGSAGIRVAADIFHVPVPGLYGASEPYHLIAFKEDFESRVAPEADEDAVPAQLLHPALHSSVETLGEGSTSESTYDRRSSVSQTFPNHLREIFLLVDVNTEHQEIQQVELNFRRPVDAVDDCHPSMPSLRKLVKPTEWEKLRSSVARVLVLLDFFPFFFLNRSWALLKQVSLVFVLCFFLKNVFFLVITVLFGKSMQI